MTKLSFFFILHREKNKPSTNTTQVQTVQEGEWMVKRTQTKQRGKIRVFGDHIDDGGGDVCLWKCIFDLMLVTVLEYSVKMLKIWKCLD